MPEPLSSSPPAAPVYEWRVIRLRGTPGTFVGYVKAPDQEQAIQKAAENKSPPPSPADAPARIGYAATGTVRVACSSD